MGVTCLVFIDGNPTGECHTFAAVPSAGDSIQISQLGEQQTLTVEHVLHMAKNADDEDMRGAHVQIRASTRKLGQ